MSEKKEGLLAGCFKDVIKRVEFERYCEELEIFDEEIRIETYNGLMSRGYSLPFNLTKDEEDVIDGSLF